LIGTRVISIWNHLPKPRQRPPVGRCEPCASRMIKAAASAPAGLPGAPALHPRRQVLVPQCPANRPLAMPRRPRNQIAGGGSCKVDSKIGASPVQDRRLARKIPAMCLPCPNSPCLSAGPASCRSFQAGSRPWRVWPALEPAGPPVPLPDCGTAASTGAHTNRFSPSTPHGFPVR